MSNKVHRDDAPVANSQVASAESKEGPGKSKLYNFVFPCFLNPMYFHRRGDTGQAGPGGSMMKCPPGGKSIKRKSIDYFAERNLIYFTEKCDGPDSPSTPAPGGPTTPRM